MKMSEWTSYCCVFCSTMIIITLKTGVGFAKLFVQIAWLIEISLSEM